MKKTLLIVVLAVGSIAASDRAAMQAVEDAAKALGGKDQVLAVNTLVVEGEGTGRNLG